MTEINRVYVHLDCALSAKKLTEQQNKFYERIRYLDTFPLRASVSAAL